MYKFSMHIVHCTTFDSVCPPDGTSLGKHWIVFDLNMILGILALFRRSGSGSLAAGSSVLSNQSFPASSSFEFLQHVHPSSTRRSQVESSSSLKGSTVKSWDLFSFRIPKLARFSILSESRRVKTMLGAHTRHRGLCLFVWQAVRPSVRLSVGPSVGS